MNITVEELSNLKRKITVTVPAADIEAQVTTKLREILRTAKLPGFRPGKVPLSLIKQRYGGQARQEVYEGAINSSYAEAIQKNELKPAGQPDIEPGDLKEGEDFQYTATVEVYPEFDVAGTDDLAVDQPTAEITDADVDDMLENLRKQATEWNAVEREATTGDRAKVDYSGKIAGEDFPGNKREGAVIELGAGQLPDALEGPFNDAISGKKAGDEVDFTLTFPDDYTVEDVQGKTADYHIIVHEVTAPTVPELDEAFASKFGIEEGGLDKLREDLTENMQRELKSATKNKMKTQVIDKLLESNKFDVPESLIKVEIDRLKEQALQRMGMPAGTEGMPELPDEIFTDQARQRVALGLIFGKLIADKEIQPDPQRVNETLVNIAASYDNPQEIIRAYQSNQNAMASIQGVVLEDQLIDLLIADATVTDVPMSFKELTTPEQNA